MLTGIILVLFLVTNRYIYGWDDQHLEIPLLKHLIDPSLYRGDYYVESLKVNFTSYLYPLLARFISVDSIPSVYLALYLLSRYFFFYWIFRLWKHISGEDLTAAFFCTVSVFLIGRTEELIYRTFSHQEFSLPFIFAGIYYFYRERFLLAACILGFAANFHALYSLFPMIYLTAYLLFFHKDKKWRHILQSSVGFIIFALPFILWTFQRVIHTRLHADPHLYDNWVELYILSCPQTFLFGETPLKEVLGNTLAFFNGLQNYIFVAVVYAVQWLVNDQFRKDTKAHAFALSAFLLICLTYFFSYVVPSHFILDLNLVRNEQYVRVLLAGYTVLLLWTNRQGAFWKVFLLSVLLAVNGGKEFSDIVAVLLIGSMILFAEPQPGKAQWRRVAAVVLFLLAAGYTNFTWQTFPLSGIKLVRWIALSALWASLAVALLLFRNNDLWLKRLRPCFLFIPFCVMFLSFCYNHYVFIQISQKGGGFWQLQRNWENMQYYVKKHTPKDALIMVPNDMEMGGFRIHSDRMILTDYRDCGIIGFDIAAAVEWRRRMLDIDAFKVFIKEPFTGALMNGIVKYKADYIVFMKYAAPSENDLLKKLYENEVFSLYQVNRNGLL